MSEAEADTTELTAHEFRAELPCEHSMHGKANAGTVRGHEGDRAIWDYRFQCTCGATARAFVCDAFKVQVRSLALRCSECRTRYLGGVPVATFEPIPEATP